MTTKNSPTQKKDFFAGLYVLLDDDSRWPRDPVEQCQAACAGGARIVQLRAKNASDSQQLEWAKSIRMQTQKTNTLFFVNDRFDIACLAKADGVHLGQEDLSPARLPRAVRETLYIGRSTHDLAQAERAVQEGVDYIAFGPVFGTKSKASPYAAQGVQALQKIVSRVAPLPVVAIGGITLDHATEVLQAGAKSLAIISAIAGAENPEQIATQFCALFSKKA